MKIKIRYAMVAFLVAALGAAALAQSGPPALRVDLNKATLRQLESLPGIGPVTARRIVEFRTKKGPFKRPQELIAVRGIGEKKYARLKDWIQVQTAPP